MSGGYNLIVIPDAAQRRSGIQLFCTGGNASKSWMPVSTSSGEPFAGMTKAHCADTTAGVGLCDSPPRLQEPTMKRIALSLAVLLATALAALADPPTKLTYPQPRRDNTVDNYFGTKVPAPYQWMENLNSPELAKWVAEENKVTFAYLDQIPERDRMKQRLTQLWNYEKVGVPAREGGKLFFSKNTGLQNQSVVYATGSGVANARELIDPNKLSPDGSIALQGYVASHDGNDLVYALSEGGSDWETLHVRDLRTGKETPDEVHWVKFSGPSWTNDNQGFFYSRYPEPPKGEAIENRVENQALYYHVLGTPQSADKKIYARPDLPEWIIGGQVSEDGRYLFVTLVNGTETKNELFYADLGDPQHPKIGGPVKPLFTANDAEYTPLGNIGDTLFVQTTKDAPNRKVVSLKFSDPS